MSYIKTNWVNDKTPAINATNLNNIENGIEEAHNSIGDLSNLNTTNKDDLVNAINEVNDKSIIKQKLLSTVTEKNSDWKDFSSLVDDFKIGDKLEAVSSGVIKVKSDCKVKISAVVGWRFFGTAVPGTKITVNEEERISSFRTSTTSDEQFTVNIEDVLDAKANDVIRLQVLEQNINSTFYAGRTSFIIETI